MTALLAVAGPGFVAAGLGAWNAPGLRRIVLPLVRASVLASFAFVLFVAAPTGLAAAVVALDLVVLAAADIVTDDTP